MEDETVTPLLFAVQLKATEKLNKKKTFSFSTERLRDYAALHMPVMIAVYDAVNDVFYFTWAHQLHRRLNRTEAASWLTKEHISIPLLEVLNQPAAGAIKAEVSSFYARLRPDGRLNALPITLTHDAEDESSFPDLTSELSSLGYYLTNPAAAVLELHCSKQALIVKGLEPVLTLPLDSPELLVPTALSALALGLAVAGRVPASLHCLHTLLTRYDTQVEAVEEVLLNPMLPMLYGKDHHTGEVQLLTESLLDAGHVNLGLKFISTFLYDSQHTTQHLLKVSKLLKQALPLSQGTQRATILCSLGNNYRSRGEFHEAIRFYFQAVRAAPGYRRKNYWWSEVASCFFRLGKYRLAERFYRQAVECGGPENEFNRVLLADALMYQGKYAAAAQELEAYTAIANPTAYAVLLSCLNTSLASQVAEQPRHPAAAEELYFSETDNPDDRLAKWAKVIELDPLFSPVHFALGVYFSEQQDKRQAAWHFLLAALFNRRDIAAWANACLLSIRLPDKPGDMVLATAIFAEAYNCHGMALEAEFSKALPPAKKGSGQVRPEVKQLMESARQFEAMYAQPSATFFRIPDLVDPEASDDFWLARDTMPDIM